MYSMYCVRLSDLVLQRALKRWGWSGAVTLCLVVVFIHSALCAQYCICR